MNYILIILLFFIAGCSVGPNPKNTKTPPIQKFYIPIDIRVEEKQNYWYKESYSPALGIIDSNTSVVGGFINNGEYVTGIVYYLIQNDKYIKQRKRIFDCKTGSFKIYGSEYKKDLNSGILIKSGFYCFKPLIQNK